MMKIKVKSKALRFLTIIVLSLFSLGLFAQSVPKGFNYQAVARGDDGRALVNKNLVVEITIRSGNPTGTIAWQEGHNVFTNDYGLFNLVIGQGITTGAGQLSSFSRIAWGANSYYLQVRIDFGNGLISMGTTKFLSVPYAIYADSVKNFPQPKHFIVDTVSAQTITTNGFQLSGGSYGAILFSDSFGNAEWKIIGGDVTNNYNTLRVVGIQGNPVVSGTPVNDQILKWSTATNSWVFSSDNEGIPTAGLGITITGTTIDADINDPLWNANKLQGNSITATAPSVNGQILKWNTSTNMWELGVDNNTVTTYNAGTGITLNGSTFNADSNKAIWNANLIYGTKVSNSLIPANGDVLKWSGITNQWESSPDAGTTYTGGTGITITGTTIDANAGTALWNANKLYGTNVSSSLTPANGEVLKWNGTTSQWESAADAGTTYTGGTGITITGTTIDASAGTALWNANKLYGTNVSSSLTPANGEVLKWNGTTSQWESAADGGNYLYRW
ncbi:hypothetical protein ACFLRI_03820 [Bacteroidota bacterium]